MGQGWSRAYTTRAFAPGFEVQADLCPCSISLALPHLAAKGSGWYPWAVRKYSRHPDPVQHIPSPWLLSFLVLLLFPKKSFLGHHLSHVQGMVTLCTVTGSSSSKMPLARQKSDPSDVWFATSIS